MKASFGRTLAAALAVFALSGVALAPVAEARGGGRFNGGGGMRANDGMRDMRVNSVRGTSVNNVNINRNVNVNRDVHVDNRGGCCHGGWDYDYHPVATAAAVTATVAVTSAVIGSIVRTLPPSCVPINYRGMFYQQCGSVWYQPQGTQYIVVTAPY